LVKKKVKTCLRCGKEFTWEEFKKKDIPEKFKKHLWSKKKFCTAECQVLNNIERYEKNKKILDEHKTCAWCGETFYRTSNLRDNVWKAKKFCNIRCYNQIRAANILAKDMKIPLEDFKKLLKKIFIEYHDKS